MTDRPSKSSVNTIQPIHVLYVEDDDADADLVFASLKNLSEPNFIPHRATSLTEAFDYLKTHSIDAVLLDLFLPDSLGFKTVALFLEQAPNLPIIVLTGTEDKALGVQAVKEGAQDYLVKGQAEGDFLGRMILYAIERKMNVSRLAATLDREHAALEQAEKAIRIRDEFLSIASHELRNPLGSLQLQIQLLMQLFKSGDSDAILQGRFQTMAEMAERQIGRFTQLIETLLDLSQIQEGRLKLKYSQFDLGDILKESVEHLSPELKKANCEIKMHIDQPVIGEWDHLRLEQVFINLILNSVKYAAGKPLQLSISSDSKNAWVRIQDQGRGIAAADKEKIFQRFERVGDTKSVSGLGLGLYVVRQIIDTHGGTIEVESELGKGTTFKIHLPLHPSEASSALQDNLNSPEI